MGWPYDSTGATLCVGIECVVSEGASISGHQPCVSGRNVRASNLLEILYEDRLHLHYVSVTIHNRVIELGSNLR